MTFGIWGSGFLNQVSTNEFVWKIDSDYAQTYYSGGYYGEIEIKVAYDGSTFLVTEEFGVVTVFEKGQFVGNLPVIPWRPDSCGPENEK